MSAITVDGDLVHYEVLGRGGRPVVLLHGWIGSWRYWIPTMRLLQLKFRVYALDLFGYGDSGKNPRKYTIDQQVALLQEFTTQLGIPKVAIIAHGLGAQVAIRFAEQYPDRVARMLIASAPLFDPGDLENRMPPGKQKYLTNASAAKTVSSGRSARDAYRPEVRDVDATIPSSQRETIRNPNNIDREALRRAAAQLAAKRQASENAPIQQAAPTPPPEAPPEPRPATKPSSKASSNGDNPLKSALSGDMEALLLRCFKKSEPEYEKLQQDVVRSDSRVLDYIARDFDAGRLLDTMRTLPMPVVVIHGEQDPLIPLPEEGVWNYITEDKDESLLPVPLPSVRHFPMLEYETFQRLVGMFLEQPDISKIELKERWRRRSR